MGLFLCGINFSLNFLNKINLSLCHYKKFLSDGIFFVNLPFSLPKGQCFSYFLFILCFWVRSRKTEAYNKMVVWFSCPHADFQHQAKRRESQWSGVIGLQLRNRPLFLSAGKFAGLKNWRTHELTNSQLISSRTHEAHELTNSRTHGLTNSRTQSALGPRWQ